MSVEVLCIILWPFGARIHVDGADTWLRRGIRWNL